ncbi:hypothetical protein ACSFXN_03885 [Planococcus sp. 1R117A]
MVEFIEQQGLEYSRFKKECWDKVKRLATNAFTDEEILNYQK